MHSDSIRPRPRGTGSLLLRSSGDGSRSWYGKWRIDGRQVMRKLGQAREPGSRQGLTRGQAEGLLATARTESSVATVSKNGIDMAEAGRRFLAHKETLGLKRSSLMDYESCIRVHLVPFFGAIALEQVDIELVEAFMAAKRAEGKAIASVLNYTVILHAIFRQGMRRGWCSRNPVADVDKPRSNRSNPDIRFLTNEELEALLAATPDDELGATERVIYLTAAMTGMRRGELLALRWQDVDTAAGLIRVRRNYSRGEFGTPKTRVC